jgi:hypothetical protein
MSLGGDLNARKEHLHPPAITSMLSVGEGVSLHGPAAEAAIERVPSALTETREMKTTAERAKRGMLASWSM